MSQGQSQAGWVARPGDVADFRFSIGELTPETLLVVGFEGTEALSELYCFRVELCSLDNAVDCAGLVGKQCVLEIAGTNGTRYVHGMARQFERTGAARKLTFYAVEIVPLHWLLTKRVQCRLYNSQNCDDMTPGGIVKKVLSNAGIPDDAIRLALQGSYTARETVVQYRESDFDFISRLMEEEGIFYFFEHTNEGHKLVLGDSGVAHVALTDQPNIPYREPTGLVADAEAVVALRDVHRVEVGAICLHDFNFTNPQAAMRSKKAGEAFTALEYYDYPGRYEQKTDGDRLAQVRLEEFQAAKRTVVLDATARNLIPGYKFTLADHPVTALNQEYLLVSIAHRARQPQASDAASGGDDDKTRYDADVRALPAAIPFRPARKTPKPVVRGTQTAIVVGASGEEIYTDNYGRVKVQFHWDRLGVYDENSSGWVRVAQGAAGGQYGMMFLPRVGQEVVVDFLEGDPDRPIVVGRVFNNDNMPPYALPDNKTKSTIKTHSSQGGGGTNEILIDDTKDSEKLVVYAQKDYHTRVKNDRVALIEKKDHLTVKDEAFTLHEKKLDHEIKLDHNVKIGGKYGLKVVGDYGLEVDGKHSQKVTGDLFLKSDGKIVIEAGGGLTIKVGGNFVKIESSGVAIAGTEVKINSGGSADSGSAVTIDAPAAPVEADECTPGADVTYSAEADTLGAVEVTAHRIEPPTPPEPPEVVTSWVEIELVDEEGNPWPDEPYEITLPNGKKLRGRLNKQGQAHIGLQQQADVQVSFPNLDQDAWEKAQ